LAARLSAMTSLEMLVNNAGFGVARFFVDADVQRHLDMVRVHVLAAVRLTHAVLPRMLERNQGAVINVSSLNGWAPCAGVVSYSATKAYVTVFTQALHDELRGTGVRMQALCPGFIRTEFHDTPEMRGGFNPGHIPGFMWTTAEQVVECSLRALPRGRAVVIPGWFNRIAGRLMQMPVAQPIVRALIRQERTLGP
ncbi:MAG: SDR family NAD(P)-dependent oxidoreductase, partial [Patescibacteria group bacterium]|nr:SDR family NAD(P)-dependent oxidoreductase [Patescibacteria group bacterium]